MHQHSVLKLSSITELMFSANLTDVTWKLLLPRKQVCARQSTSPSRWKEWTVRLCVVYTLYITVFEIFLFKKVIYRPTAHALRSPDRNGMWDWKVEISVVVSFCKRCVDWVILWHTGALKRRIMESFSKLLRNAKQWKCWVTVRKRKRHVKES